MLLYNISYDTLAEVFALLDLIPLARLYATFNIGIQKALRSPIVSSKLSVSTFNENGTISTGQTSYFLASLRSLCAFNTNILSPQDFEVLRSTSPAEVFIKSSIYESILGYRDSCAKGTADPLVAEAAQFCSPMGLPNFATLTPHLTTLEFRCYIFSAADGLKDGDTQIFPPTLTRVSFRSYGIALYHILPALPRTLLHLDCSVVHLERFMEHCHAHFTQIETMRLTFTDNPSLPLKHAITLPTSLISLRVTAVYPKAVTEALLDCIEKSTLVTLDMPNLALLPVDQRITLPRTITTLRVRTEGDPQNPATTWYPFAFPTTLTSLNLMLLNESSDFNCLLPTFTSLKRLSFKVCSRRLFLLRANEEPTGFYKRPHCIEACNLPRSLTHLERIDLITAAAINDLPPKLTFLGVASFDLWQHQELVKQVPSCLLDLSMHIPFSKSSNMDFLTSDKFAFSGEHFDVNTWARSVLDWSSLNKVSFRFSTPLYRIRDDVHPVFAQIKSIKLLSDNWLGFGLENLLCPNSYDQILTELTEVDANLKNSLLHLTGPKLIKVQARDSIIHFPADGLLPATLTHISSSKRDLVVPDNLQRPPNLTHLDTPHWIFKATKHLNWNLHNMKKLSCTITGLLDYNVLDFVTHKVDATTRANMSVTFYYVMSGILLADCERFRTQEANWSTMLEETQSTLERLLLETMPSSKAKGSVSSSSENRDVIGRVVASLSPEMGTSACSSMIRLPLTATSINFSPGTPWSLITDFGISHHGFQPPIHGNLVTELKASNLGFGKDLVRLTLSGIAITFQLVQLLPPGLLYLDLSTDAFFLPLTVDKLPPKLETFILCLNSFYSAFQPVLPLTALPASLVTLGLRLETITSDDEALKPLDLPALRTVLFHTPHILDLQRVLGILPTSQLDRLEVCNLRGASECPPELLTRYGLVHNETDILASIRAND